MLIAAIRSGRDAWMPPPLHEGRQIIEGDLPLRDAFALWGELLSWAGVDLRVFRVERPVEVLTQEQAFLHPHMLTFAPGGPSQIIGRIRPHHVRQEDRYGRPGDQAFSRFQPVRRVVPRSPVVEWGLKLFLEMAERQAAPVEETLAFAFRPADQLNVEHA